MPDDDKDLGITATGAALLALADRIDEDRDRVRRELEPVFAEAGRAIGARDFARAAELYDKAAAAFGAVFITYERENWERRARDCREVARRSKGKGRTR